MMLLRIAWRNIWRNRVRSLVVIIGLALGLWAGVFAGAFVNGMMQQKINSVITLEMAHFQIHAKGFREEMESSRFIAGCDTLIQGLKKDPAVKYIAPRSIYRMMIGSAKGSAGTVVSGILPENEKAIMHLDKMVVDGKYLAEGGRNPILISRKLSEKLKVRTGSKVVLTAQDVKGEIVSASFRVAGMFNSGNTMYDQSHVFVLQADVAAMVNEPGRIHEIAIWLNDHTAAEAMALKYQKRYPELEVLSWKDLSTGMRYMISMMDVYTVIVVGIILLALLFSIVNTMLMAVLERVRELGMLMAIGMSKGRIFSMILLETLFLCGVGCPLGLLMAWASITWFGVHGIDLGDAAYGDLGFSNLIYPRIPAIEYLKVSAMVLGMALIASLSPALKALNLKPVDAIRKI